MEFLRKENSAGFSFLISPKCNLLLPDLPEIFSVRSWLDGIM